MKVPDTFSREPGSMESPADRVLNAPNVLGVLAEFRAELAGPIGAVRTELQGILGLLKGRHFDSVEENTQVANEIRGLLYTLDQRVKCEECGAPAILVCKNIKSTKHGIFQFQHKTVSHGSYTEFPRLALIPPTADGRRAPRKKH